MADELTFADFLAQAGVLLADGSFCSASTVRLVEVIRDYDPYLEVEWIPRDRRGTDPDTGAPVDDAIRIIDTRQPPGSLARVVMSFADEGEFTRQDGQWVLERLFLADQAKHDVAGRLAATNAAAEALRLKTQLEQREEGRDFAATVLRSPLHTFRHRGPDGELRRYE